jgi:hypothetical protein
MSRLPPRSPPSLIRRLWHRRADLPLLLEATLWLGAARLSLRFLPFRHVAARLRPWVRPGTAAAPDDELRRVAWAVTLAARHVPWRAVCFHEGIAAQRLLARRGLASELIYGVKRAEGGALSAHVWVRAHGIDVVGGPEAEGYTVLTGFPARIGRKRGPAVTSGGCARTADRLEPGRRFRRGSKGRSPPA